MAINIRTKGATAERGIADDLNLIINMVRLELGIPVPGKPTVQRNQQQSAVGGCDLVGTFGLAIEVKRQEALSIGTWWAQCVKSAEALDEIPVLLFRQNKSAWRCIIRVNVPMPGASSHVVTRGEIPYDVFKDYFRLIVKRELRKTVPVSANVQTLF
jgi:hypothetical protein